MDEKVIATLECSGLKAVVEYEPKSDGYNVTVTDKFGAARNTWFDIPYVGAALHQAVDAIQIFASLPDKAD